jgi:hypothetical protein
LRIEQRGITLRSASGDPERVVIDVHRARIVCSEFEMTPTGRTRIERAFGCYTGGIDAHGARGWTVRRNTFVGIYCEDGEVAEHAIHLWRGARDTLVENNRIVNCSRGIGFGLTADRADGHRGGAIRRNAIVADIPQYDTGIELAHARDGGRGRMTRNIEGYPVNEWPVDAAAGDVHLRRGAGAVDRGTRVRGAGRDLDGAARARGRPDVGADELTP